MLITPSSPEMSMAALTTSWCPSSLLNNSIWAMFMFWLNDLISVDISVDSIQPHSTTQGCKKSKLSMGNTALRLSVNCHQGVSGTIELMVNPRRNDVTNNNKPTQCMQWLTALSVAVSCHHACMSTTNATRCAHILYSNAWFNPRIHLSSCRDKFELAESLFVERYTLLLVTLPTTDSIWSRQWIENGFIDLK